MRHVRRLLRIIPSSHNTWSDVWIHRGRDSAGELDQKNYCSSRAGTNTLRPQLVPRTQGKICTNLPLSENMVPGTGLITASPSHPAAVVDLHVVYTERCHLSYSHNDCPAAERSRWMGSIRHSPKMLGAPPWENVDIRRTEGFCDSCLLTSVEPNRCSGKPPICSQNPEQTRPCPPICSGHGICITPLARINLCAN